MDNALNIAEKMVLSINESEAYKNYISAKEKIKADKELYEKMLQFKQRHIEIQSKKLNKEYIDFNEENAVSRMFFHLIQNPLAKDYFKYEQALTDLMSEIYSKLGCQCSELLNDF